jgi:MFS family permease
MENNTQSGIFSGWKQVWFLLIAYTLPIGFAYYSPTVLYPVMIKDTGWLRGEIMIGWTALQMLVGIIGPLTAWMIGRFGARLTLFWGGITLAAAAILMGSLGHNYAVYLILSLFIGFGVSFAATFAVSTVIVAWFNVRRALAMGIVLGGGAIGGFLAPQVVTGAVLGAGGNWRIGWFIIGAACITGAMVAIIAVRNKPGDIHQYQDGLNPETVQSASGIKKPARTFRTTSRWTPRDAMRTSAMWLTIVAVLGCYFIWQMIITQGPLHLSDRGFNPAISAIVYSLAIGLSIVGRLTVAALGDKIELRYLFSFGAVCMLLGGILFWLVSTDAMWIAYLYPLFVGFGFGTIFVCFPIIIGNYWGPEPFASLNGTFNLVVLSLASLVAPFAGFIYDTQHTYFIPMLISWIGAGFAVVAMLVCKPPEPRVTVNSKPIQ